jgi:hypothetical protein
MMLEADLGRGLQVILLARRSTTSKIGAFSAALRIFDPVQFDLGRWLRLPSGKPHPGVSCVETRTDF